MNIKIKETFFCEYSEIWPKFEVTCSFLIILCLLVNYANVHNKLIKSLMIAYVKMIQYTEACLIEYISSLVDEYTYHIKSVKQINIDM